MPRDFFPRPDAQAVAFTANFSNHINAEPEVYHITPQRAAEYAALQLAYAQAYQVARDPAMATRTAVSARKAARRLVEAETRRIARMIRSDPSITAAQKIAIRVPVRRMPVRIARPSAPPQVLVRSVVGRTITVDLLDAESGKRRKPAGVRSAVIFRHVGEELPETPQGWRLALQTTRTRSRIELPAALPPGAKVWLTARWANPRGQMGPMCTATYAHMGYGVGNLPALAKAA